MGACIHVRSNMCKHIRPMTDVCYPLCDTRSMQGPSRHSHLCGRGIQHAMGTCLRPSSKQAGRMAGRRVSTTEPARGLPSRPRERLPTTPRKLVLCTGPTVMPTVSHSVWKNAYESHQHRFGDFPQIASSTENCKKQSEN